MFEGCIGEICADVLVNGATWIVVGDIGDVGGESGCHRDRISLREVVQQFLVSVTHGA